MDTAVASTSTNRPDRLEPVTLPLDRLDPLGSLATARPQRYSQDAVLQGFEVDGGDLGSRRRRVEDDAASGADPVETGHRRSTSRKGKGRQVDLIESDEDGQDDEDPEAEERKIRENLAKWSKADSNRRASMRRRSQFVTPTFPTPPPVPSASTIIRRTSTMIRRKSQSRRQGKNRKGSGDLRGSIDDVELDGGQTFEAHADDAYSQRKARRKDSVVLEAGRDGPRPPSPPPPLPTGSASFDGRPESITGLARDADPDDGPSSAIQTVDARTSVLSNGSRFIEDLPISPPPFPQPHRPRSRASLDREGASSASSTRSSASTVRSNPFASPPVTPVKNPFLDGTTPIREPTSFLDEDETPKGKDRQSRSNPDVELSGREGGSREGSPSRARSTSRDSAHSASSSYLMRPTSSVASTRSRDDKDTSRPRPVRPLAVRTDSASTVSTVTSPTFEPLSASDSNRAPSSLAYGPHSISMRSSTSLYDPPLRPQYDPRRRMAGELEGRDENEIEDAPVRNTVGILDWLLCGCFRLQGWDEDDGRGGGRSGSRAGVEQQSGRTNPME
ncbi:hypothetical protein JCM10212_005264 [Sporobolomyces blumeae]